jgi:hypothetical protein
MTLTFQKHDDDSTVVETLNFHCIVLYCIGVSIVLYCIVLYCILTITLPRESPLETRVSSGDESLLWRHQPTSAYGLPISIAQDILGCFCDIFNPGWMIIVMHGLSKSVMSTTTLSTIVGFKKSLESK